MNYRLTRGLVMVVALFALPMALAAKPVQAQFIPYYTVRDVEAENLTTTFGNGDSSYTNGQFNDDTAYNTANASQSSDITVTTNDLNISYTGQSATVSSNLYAASALEYDFSFGTDETYMLSGTGSELTAGTGDAAATIYNETTGNYIYVDANVDGSFSTTGAFLAGDEYVFELTSQANASGNQLVDSSSLTANFTTAPTPESTSAASLGLMLTAGVGAVSLGRKRRTQQ